MRTVSFWLAREAVQGKIGSRHQDGHKLERTNGMEGPGLKTDGRTRELGRAMVS